MRLSKRSVSRDSKKSKGVNLFQGWQMKHELMYLKNVGKATYKDLMKLDIHSVAELAQADPDELYLRIQKITRCKHDPCVWDVFAAIVHEAKTGIKTPWWEWSKIRKKRQAQDMFVKAWEYFQE